MVSTVSEVLVSHQKVRPVKIKLEQQANSFWKYRSLLKFTDASRSYLHH